MRKIKRFTIPFLIIFVMGIILMNGCESSRVGPDEGGTSVGSDTQQPLLLMGSVNDLTSGAGVAFASVEILRPSGASVTTTSTKADGTFSYDISNINETSLKVAAKTTGYGYSFANAKIDLTNRTAEVVRIPLEKLQVQAVTLAPTGGTASVTTQESSVPISVVIPSGAVTQSTNVSVTSVPINNVPAPTNASQNAQIGATDMQPAGITFSKPVTLTFPLPYTFKAGDKIPLMELVNNTTWQATSLSATVDGTGNKCSVDISKTAYYTLLDETQISGSSSSKMNPSGSDELKSLAKDAQVLEEQSFTFSSGTLDVKLQGSLVISQVVSNVVTAPPSVTWLYNLITQRYGSLFKGLVPPVTKPKTYEFAVPWPGISPYAQNQTTGTGNTQRPGETGGWSVRVTFESYSIPTTITINNRYWQVVVTVVNNAWREKSRNWIWTSHNQGAVFVY